MTHPRTAIRNYVVGLLHNVTAASERVQGTHIHARATGAGPAIEVRTPSDQVVERYTIAPLKLRRELTLAIRAIAKDSDAEDLVNTMADDIEQILLLNQQLGGLCDYLLLESTSVEVEAAEKHYAEAELEFAVTYYTEHAPLAQDDFTTIDAEWDLGPQPDNRPEADDTVNIPQ